MLDNTIFKILLRKDYYRNHDRVVDVVEGKVADCLHDFQIYDRLR